MPPLQLGQYELSYTVEGTGFPLVLLPDSLGSSTHWFDLLPLLGELCGTFTYEYHQQPARPDPLEILPALLDALAISRAYVAGVGREALAALHCAQYYPERLEALLLVGLDDLVPPPTLRPRRAADQVTIPRQLSTLEIPTGVFVEPTRAAQHTCAERLVAQLPRCTRITLPPAGSDTRRPSLLPLGHAMIDFLMQCERRRNLVRGASFLL